MLRYRRHACTAKGLASPKIAEEFLVHANEELAHADLLAERIVQLGGSPDLNPDTLSKRSHADYDDSTDLIEPNLVSLTADKPPVTMTADRGHVSKGGDQVDLHGNVRIQRAASAKDQELSAYMPQLTVLPDDEKAFTEHPVRITRGDASWVTGTGMKVDYQARTYVLESQVRGVIESKRAQKKKP